MIGLQGMVEIPVAATRSRIVEAAHLVSEGIAGQA